ncbi:TRAP transporter large permease [Ruegeria arenilitoris]|uniref:TRAP transporter large permease n=1 Tax=Ruegeria arenilitoris TaxID=1173585 RepID=UPI001C2B7DBA|nr:TRAP transporter large permease subunit [Ruegeria arenilitoris]
MMFLSLVGLPVVLLFLGVPVFAALMAAVLVTMVFFTSMPIVALQQIMFGSLDKFSLIAIPFFIFAGEMMGVGGISRRIINWVLSMFGGLRGGLPVTTVGASTCFGAISGSSPATVAAIGRLLYKPLLDKGYDKSFAAGLITSSGAIAIVIPPSVAMILYGIAAEQPITKLFIAGILPGLLLATILSAYLYVTDRSTRENKTERLSFLSATKEGFWALCAPVLVLGGIYLGVFSPTEAGGLASVYAIIVSVLVYREATWRDVLLVAGSAAMLTAQVMLIIAAAGAYSWLLTVNGIPQHVTNVLGALDENPAAFLILVNLLFLAVGCVLDPNSAILVLAPLLVPVAITMGIDPIHLGIIMTVNLSIGMFTPPFGLNIFVAQAVLNVPPTTIYKGIIPFLLLNLLALLVITFVPEVSLFLTHHL